MPLNNLLVLQCTVPTCQISSLLYSVKRSPPPYPVHKTSSWYVLYFFSHQSCTINSVVFSRGRGHVIMLRFTAVGGPRRLGPLVWPTNCAVSLDALAPELLVYPTSYETDTSLAEQYVHGSEKASLITSASHITLRGNNVKCTVIK